MRILSAKSDTLSQGWKRHGFGTFATTITQTHPNLRQLQSQPRPQVSCLQKKTGLWSSARSPRRNGVVLDCCSEAGSKQIEPRSWVGLQTTFQSGPSWLGRPGLSRTLRSTSGMNPCRRVLSGLQRSRRSIWMSGGPRSPGLSRIP